SIFHNINLVLSTMYGKALEMASELRDFLMFHLGLVSLRHLLFPYLFLKTYNLLTLVSSVLTMQHLLAEYQLFRSDPKYYLHIPFLRLIHLLSNTMSLHQTVRQQERHPLKMKDYIYSMLLFLNFSASVVLLGQ